jgi:hypothetical protein
VFTIKKEQLKIPKTKHKTFRLPIRHANIIENLASENGISEAQVLIQMINYCINGN